MAQTVGEYIEQDATFWTLIDAAYYYVYVDVENDNEEVLIATYYSRTGELEWENDEESRFIATNRPCEYVNRKPYANGRNSVNVEVVMYSVSEEEIDDSDA